MNDQPVVGSDEFIQTRLGNVGCTKGGDKSRITLLLMEVDDSGSMVPQKAKAKVALAAFLAVQAQPQRAEIAVCIVPIYRRDLTTEFMLLNEDTLPQVLEIADQAYNPNDMNNTPMLDGFSLGCRMLQAKESQISMVNKRKRVGISFGMITDGEESGSRKSVTEVAVEIAALREVGSSEVQIIAMACVEAEKGTPDFEWHEKRFVTFFESLGLSKEAGEIVVDDDFTRRMAWASRQLGAGDAGVAPAPQLEGGADAGSGDLSFDAPPDADAQKTVGGAATQASTLFPLPQGS